MNGFHATARIRETERKRRMPRCFVAALTGVTSEEAKTQAFASGVDQFLSKPVHLKEMKELVNRAKELDENQSELTATALPGEPTADANATPRPGH